MPELKFTVEGVKPIRPAATPVFGFRIHVRDGTAPVPIHSVVLHSQIRIEPARRQYDAGEQERLVGLFDAPERWGKTVRNILWTHVTTVVSSFAGDTTVELPVPCCFDFTIAATSYFDALATGEIPLAFLFSGTLFYESAERNLQVAQIPWDSEARFRLPAAAWHELMEIYYPNVAWLRLPKSVFDRLQRYKTGHGLPTCERAVEELLDAVDTPRGQALPAGSEK